MFSILPYLSSHLPISALVASLLYAALGVHFWREHGRTNAAHAKHGAHQGRYERYGIGLALCCQALALYQSLFAAGNGMHFSFSVALSLILWLAVFIYWLESFRATMDGLQALVLPLAALCAVLPLLFPQTRLIAHTQSWAFKIHFLSAMLAYSLFTLAAIHAIFMSIAERQLHHKARSSAPFTALPPLLTMEKVLFRMIFIASLLLSIALASGLLFSETVLGKTFVFDHKTLFAYASWVIFAALLIGRKKYGWRGKIALRWTLTGFLLLFLAYIGSRFVSEVLLGRL